MSETNNKLFGTDGIRGVANKYPMTAEVAMRFGMAAGVYYKQQGHRNRVIIAKDTRLSGYLLEPALTAGFISVGLDVILVGPMPTPAVAMLIRSLRADFGVMISASHNPYQDNGLKLFDKNGHKLSDECEKKIQDIILDDNISQYLVPPAELGKAKRLDDAPGRYVEHVKSSFSRPASNAADAPNLKNNIEVGPNLNGLKIVIDCANGSAYHLAPNIFWELGAEVIAIGVEPNGFNINADCGSTHPEALIKKVIETKADIGIALDGDADRIIICDHIGKVYNGDFIIALIATQLKRKGRLRNNTVVVTDMANRALDDYLGTLSIRTFRTQVGDRYVFAGMLQEGSNLGGEQSGHIILSDFSTTSDSIVAALQILAIMVESGKKLAELANLFQPHPQIIKNLIPRKKNLLEDSDTKAKIASLIKQHASEKILVRQSGTQDFIRVMIEGRDELAIAGIAAKIEALII